MQNIKLGFAMCGSFCTINDAVTEMAALKEMGYDITPIFSEVVSKYDTRFTNARELKEGVEALCGKKVISNLVEAEPIGPKKLFDVLVVCPCTGNTLAKLANGITDSSVTMAVKAHLRNNRPVVLAIATNDALGGSAKNIGYLLNMKNIYFTPFRQDDPIKKEKSIIADFTLLNKTIIHALNGNQISPVLL